MRGKGFACAVACSAVLMAAGSCHRIDEEDSSSRASGGEELRTIPVSDWNAGVSGEEGQAFLEPVPAGEFDIDRLWTLFPGEPKRSFERGREAFLNKKYEIGAQKIRKSIRYVKLHTLRASSPTRRALLDAEVALSELSKDVEKGKVYSLERLDTTFATTQRAIARLHQDKATEALEQGKQLAAATELQGGRESLGRAAMWTGDQVDPALIDWSERAGEAVKRLTEGMDKDPEATRRALSDLGTQLDRLDRKAEEEDVWGLFLGETQFYLKQAEERFENRDMKGAAGNMRRASACMALEAFGYSGEDKRILDKEIRALEKAGGEVEKGSLKSPAGLRRHFAAALYALAEVHYSQAGRYAAQRYYKRAVIALGATVTDLERSVSWSRKRMKKDSIRAVGQVKDMSRRMREGLPVSPKEISTAISALEKTIDRQAVPSPVS